MATINGNEFPIKSVVEDLRRRGRLKTNSLVLVGLPDKGRGDVYLKGRPFLGKLDLLSLNLYFARFLDKFAKRKGRGWWWIEYGFLARAYEVFKRNPQELENITKVAKNKKDLKFHLGVS